ILGTGWVAGEHVKAFQSDPRSEVRAVCGRDQGRSQAFADGLGLTCKVYTDMDALLAQDGIDIVVVATPPNVHEIQAVAAAKSGKHILLEKAMAVNVEQGRAIRDAVAEAGVKSVVSFVLRWNPLIKIIRKQLEDNAIGKVYMGEVDYFHGIGPWYGQYGWNVKKDVGVSSLLSAGCHALDALRCFMGGEVAEVTQYSTYGGAEVFKEYEYEPTTLTILKFADGRIGKVASCIECIQPYVFNINLVGTHGTIKNNKIWSTTKYPGQNDWVEVPAILPDSGDVSHHAFSEVATHLIDCIENDVESNTSIADGFKSHEICCAADLSGQTGKPVELPLS
ncbi:MAG: Gfo/Idh/MocA family oxidoreductase, partial [Candidatus Hydrogenedentes bacterium]|nr:Gfo/Idh/MocA family oxidoreductase [Candidatus Hydrogenedentota bacterium]